MVKVMYEIKVGDKFRSKNGMVGTVTTINGVDRLVVKNFAGRITQTLNLKTLNMNKFQKIEYE